MVTALGLVLGSLKFRGIGLGIGGVLFAGLLLGHLKIAMDESVLEFAREFGLVLFVYTIGLQVGPGITSALKKDSLPLNMLASSVVLLGVVGIILVNRLGHVPMPVAVGIYTGAVTNTPALAAAQQALKDAASANPEIARLPGLGYAMAYPLGLLGIIGSMIAVRIMFRVDASAEAKLFQKQQTGDIRKPLTLNIEITNPNLEGLQLRQVPGYGVNGVAISRIHHKGTVDVAQPDSILRVGDTILMVGPEDELEKMRLTMGRQSDLDLKKLPSSISTSRILVTQSAVLGKRLDELDFLTLNDVTVTRASRAEIEFTPGVDYRLQFGDRLLAVGQESDLKTVATELGNSLQRLNHPQIIPIMVGIALGILVGSIPFSIPGVPVPVKLGMAGGPLLVAIILSRVGRVGPLVWYMPNSANMVLREVGIAMFLSCVGLKSGEKFVETLIHGGAVWMVYGVLVTVVPLLVVAAVARIFMKLNFMTLCGLLAGSMTDPPALAFSSSIATSDAPSVSYSTVYPLVMFLRVISAQILVMIMVS
ncbi:MAG: putative transporter [Candidatus Sumerlaeaceae bacterium]|nr:putative transporter [Candidatus Sumerlaeaceae bacterium]